MYIYKFPQYQQRVRVTGKVKKRVRSSNNQGNYQDIKTNNRKERIKCHMECQSVKGASSNWLTDMGKILQIHKVNRS